MFQYYFTFRSLTAAQSAKNALYHNGIAAVLDRAPRMLSSQGCGYALRVPPQFGLRAAALVRTAGHIFRVYPGGTAEEVRL